MEKTRNERKKAAKRGRRHRRERRLTRIKVTSLVATVAALCVLAMLFASGALRGNPEDTPAAQPIATQHAASTPDSTPAASPESSGTPDEASTDAPIATPAATPTPSPTPAPTPHVPRSATIRSLGDFVIHDAIIRSAKKEGGGEYDFSPMFEMVKHVMGGASYTVANVEGAMGGAGKRGYVGFPRFNTPPELMAALLENGVDMLTLANNHALDEYYDGLKATMDNCDAYGLAFVGAARTREERNTPVIVDIEGISVGFLNYTDHTNGREKGCSPDAVAFGVAYIRGADFKKDVDALKGAGADVIVTYLHWGNEYVRKAEARQTRVARQLAEAGVDVIVGTHPHVVQSPVEWISVTREDGSTGRTLCVYSLGNFISNQPQRFRDAGIVFEFTIEEIEEGKFEINSPKYIPTFYWTRGREKSGYTIRIVPCGEWLDERPEGMDKTTHDRVKQVWKETIGLLGEEVAVASAN